MWSETMDRHGPKDPTLRFLVDLAPWLALFAVLAVVYLVAR